MKMCQLQEKYKKYNLFELLYLFNKSDINLNIDIDININMSKKEIINIFVINELNINFSEHIFKVETKEPVILTEQSQIKTKESHIGSVQGNNIKWKLQKIIRQTYNIVILDRWQEHIFEIYTGDIIKIKNKEYVIFMRLYQFLSHKKISLDDERYDTMYICLHNLKTDEKKEYTTQELIDLIINEDVTYIKSHHLDLSKSKSVEFNKSKSIDLDLIAVYIGAGEDMRFIKNTSIKKMLCIDSLPKTGFPTTDHINSDKTQKNFLDNIRNNINIMDLGFIESKISSPSLLIFNNFKGQEIRYYTNTPFPSGVTEDLKQEISKANTLIICGYHPHKDIFDMLKKPINIICRKNTYYGLEEVNENSVLIKLHEKTNSIYISKILYFYTDTEFKEFDNMSALEEFNKQFYT
jgi:hypothetical protein